MKKTSKVQIIRPETVCTSDYIRMTRHEARNYYYHGIAIYCYKFFSTPDNNFPVYIMHEFSCDIDTFEKFELHAKKLSGNNPISYWIHVDNL